MEIYGPIYDSHKIEGATIRIAYKHVGKGLAFKGGDKLQGFQIAGADGKFEWADAKIDGDIVLVWSKDVPEPVFVRYGMASNPPVNLFNQAGLPAVPFRSNR